jgi:hypothetical protein
MSGKSLEIDNKMLKDEENKANFKVLKKIVKKVENYKLCKGLK